MAETITFWNFKAAALMPERSHLYLNKRSREFRNVPRVRVQQQLMIALI